MTHCIRKVAFMVSVGVACAIAMPVDRQVTAATEASRASRADLGTTLEGSIISINLASTRPTISIRAKDGAIRTIALISPAVRVTENGQPVQTDQLRIGQSIRLQPTTRNGQQVAESIEVVSAGTSPGREETTSRSNRDESGSPNRPELSGSSVLPPVVTTSPSGSHSSSNTNRGASLSGSAAGGASTGSSVSR